MQKMTADTVSVILSGNTVTLERADGAKTAIYYGSNGIAYMNHPEHGGLSGPWTVHNGGYAVVWDKGVGEMRWTLAHGAGGIAYLDGTGAKRASLLRMERGDCQNLAH